MKKFISLLALAALLAGPTFAQPAYSGPMPVPPSDTRTDALRRAYLDRVKEVLVWYSATAKPDKPETIGTGQIVAKLALHQDAGLVSQRIIELMKQPQTGDMFWMFPWAAISFLGRDQLSAEAKAAIRDAWRTYFPMRGDTENH